MESLVQKEKWIPADGMILEKNALDVVKSNSNMLVVAGPGAGKSELLAQRACYLLQTNKCKEPKRILAVSFKKDSAVNIKERVTKRCSSELSSRFDSMTFDAFAKTLVDQFLNAIPNEYRPSRNYEVIDDKELIKLLRENEIFNYQYNNQYMKEINKLTNERLPFDEGDSVKILWEYIVNKENGQKCYLTFKMINRLAEYLIRSNPLIKKVLNITYSHIFLDEYQDTTSLQYDLLKTCFYGEDSIITAVGDDKQRIMVWAGALKDSFERFAMDFNGKNTMLIMNHRSAPRLLKIQKTIYREFFYKDSEVEFDIENNPKWNSDDGESYLHLFNNDDDEAKSIAQEIYNLIQNGYSHRDICILVKQTPDRYCKKIIESLAEYKILARNEVIYQDILKEELVLMLNNFIKVVINEKSPKEWTEIYELMFELNEDKLKDLYDINEFEKKIRCKIIELKEVLLGILDIQSFNEFIYNLLNFIDIDKYKGKYDQYKNENTFKYYIDKYCELLWKEYEVSKNWNVALNNFKGENSIPIMTIHKSKGLEYDVVFFIGLEDDAFWNFNNQKNEDFCTFFVALSRAKKRVDFTFSSNRNHKKQSLDNINEFYKILEKSKVVNIKNRLLNN
ncbi:MAG: ATP-dependent helicase [Clostridium sp.]|nr:ATP-dependent helicase [Clostridium sp.]MCI7441828.1 ATP-dependent helicase [Clostridium sp.]MDY4077176.1 ATP-dependent helicase [Clostridium sp.]MDY4543870.1 ATP-dependent helicase [Bacilli bacterium]